MDFLDPAKKRAHHHRLFLGYFLVAVAISLTTLILVLLSYGYWVDRETGAIIQNGIVFVSAQPEAADVYLNNEKHKAQTDTRIVLPGGLYDLELRRSGYRSWKRHFNLEGGDIERFVYPFLFPETLNPKEVRAYPAQPTFATQSLDRQWLLVQQPGQNLVFDVFDLNDPEKSVTSLTAPADLMTASEQHTFATVEWSSDNRHVLIQHTFKEGYEFLMIDRENPAQSVNVNRSFGRSPTQVTLRDKKHDKFYFYNAADQSLVFADLKSTSVTPVLSGVLAFKSHGEDMIVYATSEGAPSGKSRIKLRDNDGTYTLRDVTAGTKYLLDLARFDGSWYMLVGEQSEGKVYVYKNPLNAIKATPPITLIPTTILRVENIDYVAFSNNARFMLAEGGSRFAVYDAETKNSYRYDTKLTMQPGQHATWMDGHRLMIENAGKTIVFDYDGINMQTLTPSLPGFLGYFDRDYKRLYNLAPSATGSANKAAVQRVNLNISDKD